MTIDRAAEILQFTYPLVYHACHTRHDRARSSASRLSARDAQVLVHLDRAEPTTLSALARHMGLSASTLSAAVTTLSGLGYIRKSKDVTTDRRRVGLVLTPAGVAAVRHSSVLESDRLRMVLRRLTATERRDVATALTTLAGACRR